MNGNNTIITSYTNTTDFTVKDAHTIGSAQNWNMYYGSNTTWATIIGANSLVNCDIPENEVWVGSPAKKLK